MRVLSNEHAAEMQLLDLSRLTRFKDLCFGAGASADDLACEFLAMETGHPEYQADLSRRELTERKAA